MKRRSEVSFALFAIFIKSFPSYLQQAIMESNGKSVDRNGDTN